MPFYTASKSTFEVSILNIDNFLTALTICFFIDKFGRRPLFLLATGGMCGSFIIWTICAAEFKQTGVPAAVFAEIAFILLNFAHTLRARGLTLMFLAVDLALFFNSYVNPIALAKPNWKYYIVYDCWLVFEFMIVYFYYIETRNTPLEEIVRYFDSEQALLDGDLATEKARQILVEEGVDHKAANVQHFELNESGRTSGHEGRI